MPDSGNEAQMRIVLDQVAEAAAMNVAMKLKAGQLDQHPDAPVPPMVKWLVGAIAAFGSAALIGLGFWLVTSVSSMRETLARMDERQSGADTAQVSRDGEQDRRITTLETFHKEGGR